MPITKLSATTDFDDQIIKNVTEIQLKTIVSDDDTSVSLGLGTDVGDNFIVATDALVVLGETAKRGYVGVGTASPDGALHVMKASAGSVTASGDGNALVVENSDVAGMSLLSPGDGAIYFGDVADNDIGRIVYKHSNDSMNIWTNNAARLTIDSSGNATSTGVVTATGFTIGSAEINETELEILDGATLSTTELNYVDGVSSAIQTQLDSKISATLTEEQVDDFVGGMVTGNTETFIAVTYEDGDGTLDFVVPVLDEDGMGTDSASHLATQQSIKAYVDASGGGSLTIQAISASATATVDTLIVVDSSGGVVTVTLPAVSGNAGKFIIVKARHGSVNAVTVDGNSAETIDGAATQTLNTNMASMEVLCDGSTWWIR